MMGACDDPCGTGIVPHQLRSGEVGCSKCLLPETANLRPHSKDAILDLVLIN